VRNGIVRLLTLSLLLSAQSAEAKKRDRSAQPEVPSYSTSVEEYFRSNGIPIHSYWRTQPQATAFSNTPGITNQQPLPTNGNPYRY
jgi:hypothetical protein